MDDRRLRWVREGMGAAVRGAVAVLFLCAGAASAQVPAIGPGVVLPVSYSPGSRLADGLERLERELAQNHPELPRAALARAFEFLRRYPVANRSFVAIADFDRPSDEPRLNVIRLSDGRVERFLVAHGSGSGERYATRFSNEHDSHQSSLGVYLTGEEYQGDHGRSLTLRGMEATNDQAEARSVVLHGAAYVSEEAARSRGRVGRSWGCPAVSFTDLDHIIDELKGGAVLLVYSSAP